MTAGRAGGIDPTLREDARNPFHELLGTRTVEASGDRVVLTLAVDDRHHQAYGIVHGGVYATLAETAASIGAHLASAGGGAVGITNTTDFLRATRDGVLRVEATPVSRGRQLQLWEVAITDDEDRLVARSSVKLFNVRADRAELGPNAR